MRTLLIPIVLLAACATDHKPKERALSAKTLVANSMCAIHGTQASTNDPVGERMICAFEEPTGSHVPVCTCHDEKQLAEDRDTGQAFMRDAEHTRCGAGGVACATK